MRSLTPNFIAEKPLVIAFDWGDTLMWNDPTASGPMTTWPVVAAVPGAAAALDALSKNYQLVVATNAAASNAHQIKLALARVGLDKYFSEIFTIRRTGHRKPETAYFQAISEDLDVRPEQMVMVGDDAQVDAAAAVSAGWQAVWYNPGYKAPPGLAPPHGQEIYQMEQLPAAVEGLAEIPSLSLAMRWLAENGGDQHLFEHVQVVAAIAYQMAVWMNQNNCPVNTILAQRGGLLHDLGRPLKEDGLSHANIAARQLNQQGLSRLAGTAQMHMLFGPLENEPPSSMEEKLVYFCDKLVEQGQLVSLEERLEALTARYKLDPQKVSRIHHYLTDLQADLCSKAEIDPKTLVERLKNSLAG